MLKKIAAAFDRMLFSFRLRSAGQYGKAGILSAKYGMKVGKNIRITGNVTFGTEPYLIELGNDITITQNVVFHTHDGGVWVFRNEYPGINVFRRIKVGNNVFIGANSSIMPGVTIGDNIVIAAGSVVTKDCESDSVYGGVPARKLKTLSEYKEKVLKEAVYITTKDTVQRKKQILGSIKG